MMDSQPWNVPLWLCHRGGFAANPILPGHALGLGLQHQPQGFPVFPIEEGERLLAPLKQKIQKEVMAPMGRMMGMIATRGDIICPLSKRELCHSVARKYGFQKNLKFFKKAIDKMNLT